MAKAIIGAAMLVGAVVATVVTWGAASPLLIAAIASVASMGISMEASALAQSLSDQRGVGITTRQAAGLRQIVYGQQRIGGTSIYQSTTGAGGPGNYVFNYIIVLTSHAIDGIVNLYLDGRQVYWKQDGSLGNVGCGSVANPPVCTATIGTGGLITAIAATGGSGFANVKPTRYRVRINGGGGSGASAYATNSGTPASPVWTVHMVNEGVGYTSQPEIDIQGAFTFGGVGAADEQDPSQPGYGLGYGIGPGGPHYDFSGKVYCEARFGDQPAGDYMQSLYNNDPTWQASCRVAGCAYIYLNVGYDTSNFPTAPEVRLTVTGKNDIFDPRTGKSGYSTNWALQVADVITDPVWGLGDNTVNQAQLIAAANVCDELVMTSQGNEINFAQHIHYDTASAPGDVLAMMMPAAGGRLSRIGGEWFIWPAYWQGPSFTLDESSLLDDIQWEPYRSFKDLINRVNGTYIAPNSPYNVAGNLYDSNGWYYGATANLWPLAWQPTNYPQYACDVRHGYGTDVYLAADGGTQLPKELSLRGVISIVQAQRLAKIDLLRNRHQGSGVFRMNLAAWQMQPIDVIEFSMPLMSWANKYLEIDKVQLIAEPMKDGAGEEGPMMLSLAVSVQETDPSIYEWAESEELTPYDVPAAPGNISSVVPPPTGLTLTDNATTSVMQSDGTVMPRLLVSWTPPADTYVNNGGSIQVQWQDYTAVWLSGAWVDAGTFSGNATNCLIDNVSAVTAVNVQVRSIRSNGATSVWVGVNNHTLPRPRPQLSAASQVTGTTVNPAVASAFADLPELGSGDASMTIDVDGNACLVGVNLAFACATGSGGGVSNVGRTFSGTTASVPPTVTISIAGDGAGASATLTFSYVSGSGAGTVWSASLAITPGSGYTHATATVVISGSAPGYSAGTTTYSCTISGLTPVSGQPIQIQVLMDGAQVLGPAVISTDVDGNAEYAATVLILPAPAAGNHVFEVQAMTTSADTIVSTARSFQLVELA